MKFHEDGTILKDRYFVFGSNLSGRHGKGAALAAIRLGAIYGNPYGLQGRTYAIPTKDSYFRRLSIAEIRTSVKAFKNFVKENPEKYWQVTRVACGLAGYKDSEIAPLFKGIKRCSFPEEWRPYLVGD